MLPLPCLVVNYLVQGVEQADVPVSLGVVDGYRLKVVCEGVLDLFPVNLERQHDVCKDLLCNLVAPTCLEYGLKFVVFFLAFLILFSLLVADRFEEAKLVFYVKLDLLE